MGSNSANLTIAMVVRNEEKHMSTAINSLLQQTYSEFSLIIVNNGSTDSTGEIAGNYAKQDKRVTVIHLEHNEPAVGFQLMDRSNAKYWMAAAGHDFYAPSFIEKCIAMLEADQQVVLAYPRASWLKGDKIAGEVPGFFDTRGLDSYSRALAVAVGVIENYQGYGIHRLAPLKSLKRQRVIGSDHVLLTELAFFGTFALVNEHLFFLRMADDWGDSKVYLKKHGFVASDGIRAFLQTVDAYMSIAERVNVPLDKTIFKLSLFTMCLLRYRNILPMFGESIASLFARPDFQELADAMSSIVSSIEPKLQTECSEKTPSSMQPVLAPTSAGTNKAKVKIAGEGGEGKDLTQIQDGSEFETHLRKLVLSIKPRSVIETGTYIGKGTTRIIAAALRDAELAGTTFYSIECNPDHHRQAVLNLGQTGLLPFVHPLLGLSVPRAILPTVEKIHDDTVQNISGDDIYVDHQEQNRVALYHRETDFPDLPDDLLGDCMERVGRHPDLVLLDSAGHMGNVEFNYLIGRLEGECYLVLDDTRHIKHYRSFQQIQQDPRFIVIKSSDEKFGFCIAKFSPGVTDGFGSRKKQAQPAHHCSAVRKLDAKLSAAEGPLPLTCLKPARLTEEQIGAARNFIFLRTDSIGDNILASSMLPHISEHFKGASITVVCQEYISELYEACPYVARIISFNRARAIDDEAYRNEIIRSMRELGADVLLNSVYSREPLTDFLALECGARQSVAHDGDLSNMTDEVRQNNNALYTTVMNSDPFCENEIGRCIAFLHGIGIDLSKLEPAIWIKPEDDDFAESFFRDNNLDPARTVCLFAGAQYNLRIYQGYGDAISDICREYGFSVIGLGSMADSDINRVNLDATGVRSINLSGKTTLRETAAIIKRCRLAVGAETGLAHMACAVGTPNVILLGGGHFGRFMPYSPLTSIVCLALECYGCNWACKFSRVHCIKDINPVVLAEAVRQTLEKRSGKSRIFVQGISLWERKPNQPQWQSFHDMLNIADTEIVAVGDIPSFTSDIWDKLKPMDKKAQIHLLTETAGDFISQGEKLFSCNDFQGAELAFSRALELQRNSPVALNNLGVLYYRIGEKEKALHYYEAAVKNQPANTTFLKNLADFHYVVRKDIGKALQLYIKGLSINPEDIEILLALGNISIEIGQLERAENLYKRVLAIDPDNKDAATIIDLLANQGQGIMCEQADETTIDILNQPDEYLVSAIVSTYNSERFIRGRLEDLEAQTIAGRMEIIVVDSGSQQNERAIVEEFQKRYTNIRYIRTPKRETVYQAWNRGIREARGKFITNANTDDRLRKDCIETLVKALQADSGKPLAYGDSIVTVEPNEIFDTAAIHSYLRWPDFDRTMLLEYCYVGPHPLWRKVLHDEIGYFDERYQCAADYEFWLRASMRYEFIHVPELLGLYWLNEETVSRKGDLPILEARQIQADYRKRFQEQQHTYLPGTKDKDHGNIMDTQAVECGFSVLLVVHNFLPHNVAGVENYTFNLAKELTTLGVNVSVFYPLVSPGWRVNTIVKGSYRGITTYTLAVDQPDVIASLSHAEKENVFRDFITSNRFDLVHIHHTHFGLPISLVHVAKHAGIPVILTLHDFWFICLQTHLYRYDNHTVCSGPETVEKCCSCFFGKQLSTMTQAEQEVYRNILITRQQSVHSVLMASDLITSPSRFVADTYAKYGYGENRIVVSPLGIIPITARERQKTKSITFGYIGTIHEIKDIYGLVDAFSSTHGNARLLIYGAGTQDRIEYLKKSIKDARIEYRGAYSAEQLTDILARMDLIIVPSLIESYCLTVREALAAGIPVIASRAGGIPEIVIHGENGILFNPGDRRELQNAIQRMIDDPDSARALRHKGPIRTITDDAAEWQKRYLHYGKQKSCRSLSHKASGIQNKLKIGFLSLDKHSFACPRIRLLSAMRILDRQELIDYVDLPIDENQQLDTEKLRQLDILIVQRNFAKAIPYEKLTAMLGEKRPKIVYEFDDAFGHLDKGHIAYYYYQSMKKEIEDYIRNSDLVTVSTEVLKSYYHKMNKNIAVIPNFIDGEIWHRVSKEKKDEKIRLIFSGTIGHEPDLKIIEKALTDILNEFKDSVELLLWGNHNSGLEKLSNVKTLSKFKVDYSEYAEILKHADVDIALVPLVDNRFNQAKSCIKWLEYSACNIPGIYSRVAEYTTCIKDGVTGILAENTYDSWYQAIKRFILDKSFRKAVSQQANQEVMQNYSVGNNAQKWLSLYEGLYCRHQVNGPIVSIVMPVYNKLLFTKQSLNSLIQNTPRDLYEIIIVDNGSTDGTQDFLSQLQIKPVIIMNNENLGFAKACNQGAQKAACKYLLFLNNDTEPQPGWLVSLLDIVEKDDTVVAVGSKLLYPDGTIQHGGVVIVDDRKNKDPLLARNNHVNKPSAAPEANEPAFYQALTAACVLISRKAFIKAGGFDEKYWNGYEDVDLCFKLQEQGGKLVYQPASVVIHHESRSGPERFARARNNVARLHKKWLSKIKPDIIINEDGAVTMTDAGKTGPYIVAELPGNQRMKAATTIQPGLVSIVILTFNELKYTKECIESIKRHTPEPHEVIIVDNASTDGTVKWLKKIVQETPNCRLLENKKNLGFAKGCNQGIEKSSGEYVLLLNNDVVVTDNWLSGMLECLNTVPDTGIVGPMTNNISGPQKVQDADYKTMNRMHEFAQTFRERYRHRRVPLRRIVGFCMLFRRTLVDKIGLLDESFGTGNFEDDDYCLRATLAGYLNLIAGDVFIHHYGSRSFIGNRIDYSSTMSGNIKILDEKWTGIAVNTPLGKKVAAYNMTEKADILYQRGYLDKAISMLIEGIKYAPEEKIIYYYLAEMLLGDKLYKDALDAVNSMPCEANNDLKRLEIVAYGTKGTEGSEEAGKYADQILDRDKNCASALNLKGIIAHEQGDDSSAENFFRQAIAADPGYGEPYTNQGMLKWALDQKEEALALLEKGFMLSPTRADNINLYHSAITALEQFGRAEKTFQDAIELHPDNKRILFFLIDSLLKQGKFERAMHEIERTLLNIGIDDGILSAALAVREKVGIKEIDKAAKNIGTLSLCMIVKNEEQHLARCLLSVAPAVNEMIIVDTGSTDRTKDIARAYGARVFDFQWTDDFSEARNYSLARAAGDWIVVLDADEVISPQDYSAFERIVKKRPARPVAYTMVTRNYTNEINAKGWTANDRKYLREEAGTGWFPSVKVRLFVNDKRIRFQNPVHEFVEASLEKAGIEIKTSVIPVHHYGRFDKDKIIAKGKNYFLLGKKKIEEMKGDIKALKELAIQAAELGEYETAVELWEKVIELNRNDSVAFLNISYAYLKLNKYQEALDSSRRATELDPAMKEAALNYAGSEFIIGDIRKTISVLETLLQKDPDYPPAMVLIAAAYYVAGQKENGLGLFEKLQKRGFSGTDFIDEQARGCISLGRLDQAVLLLELAIGTGNINKDTQQLLAECRGKIESSNQ
jgi:GT2 family glycosyltransferase/glycosyltransferase involved in cell wall biosynthesis/Flp pilus assembly protein TadD/predicted O-methyltransferase YrrM